MEAPLINFGQARRLRRDNCHSTWTVLDGGISPSSAPAVALSTNVSPLRTSAEPSSRRYVLSPRSPSWKGVSPLANSTLSLVVAEQFGGIHRVPDQLARCFCRKGRLCDEQADN